MTTNISAGSDRKPNMIVPPKDVSDTSDDMKSAGCVHIEDVKRFMVSKHNKWSKYGRTNVDICLPDLLKYCKDVLELDDKFLQMP